MDKGEFAKAALTVMPAANGSYLVRRFRADRDDGFYGGDHMACFSNYSDLLDFLNEEYRAANIHPASQPVDEGDGK